MIYGILSDQIDSVWERIEPLVSASIRKANENLLTVGDVYQKLLNKEYQLWMVHSDKLDGIVITQLTQSTITAVVVAGKDMDKWIDEVDQLLIDFGKHHGVKYIESYSRRGFHKTMIKHGFKVAHVVYRKEIQ